MRKLYLIPWKKIEEHHPHLANDFTGGVHWFPIDGNEKPLDEALYLVSVDFVCELWEERVLADEDVIELPCPIQEGNKTLQEHIDDEFARYNAEHHDKLKKVFMRASLNLEDHHTIFHVSELAKKLHPLVKIGRIKPQYIKKSL